MLQADRLYERLNALIGRLESHDTSRPARSAEKPAAKTSPALEEYPGNNGDWLVYHVLGEPRTLNPISVEGTIEAREVYSRNIFETLFDYDLDYDGVKLIPMLAESMDVSEDGLQMTVKLKKDIWFSDGVPITADDVLFSYQTIMDPNVDAADVRNYYYNFRDVVKIDDHTVRFIFKELYWKTLESVGVFEILPKHLYQYTDAMQFNTRRSNPVGSGPYIFERWDVGQQIVLRRNENYWGRKPRIDRLVFKFITNLQAALQALRAGDIDMMEPSSEQFFELSQDEQFKQKFHALSYWKPSKGFSYIGWNQARPLFQDRRVRLALTHAVNREAIAKYIQKGFGKVTSGPFYIYGRQADPNITPWPYDIERAKQLMDEAGWRDTDGDGIRDMNGLAFRFKLSYPAGNDTAEQIVKMFKDDASKIGVDITADPVEWSIYVEQLNNRSFDAAICAWGGTIESDPYQIFHSSQIEGRGNNFVSFNCPAADTVIEEARRTLAPEKRYALYHRFHQILHEEQPYTFLVVRPEYLLLDKRFENVQVHKLGIDPLEWYVPKEKQRYK
jgi:peptide/nickel transport system substrate-binding protein